MQRRTTMTCLSCHSVHTPGSTPQRFTTCFGCYRVTTSIFLNPRQFYQIGRARTWDCCGRRHGEHRNPPTRFVHITAERRERTHDGTRGSGRRQLESDETVAAAGRTTAPRSGPDRSRLQRGRPPAPRRGDLGGPERHRQQAAHHHRAGRRRQSPGAAAPGVQPGHRINLRCTTLYSRRRATRGRPRRTRRVARRSRTGVVSRGETPRCGLPATGRERSIRLA